MNRLPVCSNYILKMFNFVCINLTKSINLTNKQSQQHMIDTPSGDDPLIQSGCTRITPVSLVRSYSKGFLTLAREFNEV